MEKINDIVEIVDDTQVIAIESKSSQYFFGTKSEIKQQGKSFLQKPIIEKEIINDVLCLTI